MKFAKRWSKMQGFFLTILFSVGATAFAQAPSGTFRYDFTPAEGPALWNFSGNYATSYYVTNDVLELRHNGNGRIEASYRAPGVANGGVYGTVRGAASALRFKLVSEMWFPGTTPDFWKWRRDRLSLNFDAETGTLTGIDRIDEAFRVVVYDEFPYSHMKTLSRWSTSKPASLEVPEATDGAWTLVLNIIPSGNKLAGTASIRYANGMVQEFQLSGSYSAKRQTTKVLLKGTGTSKGATLILSLVNPGMGIERMNGRVGGQSVKF